MIEDLSVLFGALIFNSLYPLTRSFFNGTMLLSAAAALVLPLAATLYFAKKT